MAKKVIIIGGGIAGLSAGCYARMNGYDSEIYEMHDKPGGLCTAWQRKGYTIDGCLHWLTGSSPGSNFYQLWAELGAVQGRRMIDPDVFYCYTGSEGRKLSLYCDADRLEAHLKELAPGDSATIELLCRLIRRFAKLEIPIGKAFELYNVFDLATLMARMIPFQRDYNLCNRTTMGEFAQRFQDPFLREAFSSMMGKDYTLFALVATLSLLHAKAGGFPEGGSLEFARAIEKRFLDLGGQMYYKCRVTKILAENGKATGIRLADGREIEGDYVISAADLRTTLYEMLDGKYIDPMHEELFRSVKLAPSSVQVSFGVNLDLSTQPGCVGEISQPPWLKEYHIDQMMVKNYCFDPTLAPPGKSVITCMLPVEDYEHWEKLAADKKAYRAEKERLAGTVADELEHRYPGFKSAIEVTDVATPMTYVRYTGNWKGSYMTWIIPPDQAKRFRVVKKTVPGLDNFWLSSMWVQPPGGVPSGAMASRHVIQLICRKDKKRFQTSIPEAK